jgi:solute carrier family 34 (sodium-dependent phosphate cotransporter)
VCSPPQLPGMSSTAPSSAKANSVRTRIPIWLRLIFVLALLFVFLVAIRLMGSSIKAFGEGAAGDMFSGVANPFAGLAVGTLATVLVQSSSTTTSTIVSLVGNGTLRLTSAVPMIMGANIGTTITNTIVSIGHVRQGNEFRRAFAAATVHDFFNLLCVLVLLPVEIGTGVLEKSASAISGRISSIGGTEFESPVKAAVKASGDGVKSLVESSGLDGRALAGVMLFIGITLTFLCLIFITKNLKVVFSGALERTLNRQLGRSGMIGIGVGILMTVAVQSSSITTSLLVPMCAAGVLTLRNAFPIMLGANIGTTVTALLASMGTDSPDGLTIALVHLLFNLSGVLLIFPFPILRDIPIALAEKLASGAQKRPIIVVAYVGGVFVLLPLLGYLILE